MQSSISRRSLFVRPQRAQPVAVIGEACLANAFVVCRSCGDACPERAIGFRPRLGAPEHPFVTAACNGCGACVSSCPVSAIAMAGAEAAS
ncbi:MAG: 4Fe-4S dicluster domain-containing protein [Rhodoblastus sp.]